MRALVSVLLLWLALPLGAQKNNSAQSAGDRHSIPAVFDFENETGTNLPPGWVGGPAATLQVDNQVAHSGKWSVRLERSAESHGQSSALTKSVPVDFKGKEIELRGYLRLADVERGAGLWLREDGDEGQMLSLANMDQQMVGGTKDWAEYSVKLPVKANARTLFFGAYLVGTGTAWVDDLRLLIDGAPIADAPEAAARVETGLDRDHEFDNGSRVALTELSQIQIENLVTLGRVWGFLKYHHPAVVAGERNWDYDLFRVLPHVLAARSEDEANAALVEWIDGLGQVPDTGHARLDVGELEFGPDIGWISDTAALGSGLSKRLEAIYKDRPTGNQFYVSLAPNVANPIFDHERIYGKIAFPDAGFHLLALYRFWNIMQYWSPNRGVAGVNWPDVLREFVPRVALAKNKNEYEIAMLALIAKANDTHANLWSSLDVRPPVGECRLPINLRFVEDKLVVTSFASKMSGPRSGFRVGDVIDQIDGDSVESRVDEWAPFYADSNEAARHRDMARSFTNGSCGPAHVSLSRPEGALTITTTRVPASTLDAISKTDDLAGPTFRLLSKDVAYLKLSSIKTGDVATYIEQARGTKGLIIDIRNYPSEFVVFALGDLLVNHDTPFARFTAASLANPGAFYWGYTASLSSALPHYSGKIVILVDETSVSQAEFTAMAFRSTPNAVVVGSMTAGADGNVSEILLPGNLRTAISGLGVFYPDKRPTQRVGIAPDVEAHPTIAGIRAGRDEVLEAGIGLILGESIPPSEIEKIATPGGN
jgi:C-terminal processing protease CtpA/Prc